MSTRARFCQAANLRQPQSCAAESAKDLAAVWPETGSSLLAVWSPSGVFRLAPGSCLHAVWWRDCSWPAIWVLSGCKPGAAWQSPRCGRPGSCRTAVCMQSFGNVTAIWWHSGCRLASVWQDAIGGLPGGNLAELRPQSWQSGFSLGPSLVTTYFQTGVLVSLWQVSGREHSGCSQLAVLSGCCPVSSESQPAIWSHVACCWLPGVCPAAICPQYGSSVPAVWLRAGGGLAAVGLQSGGELPAVSWLSGGGLPAIWRWYACSPVEVWMPYGCNMAGV